MIQALSLIREERGEPSATLARRWKIDQELANESYASWSAHSAAPALRRNPNETLRFTKPSYWDKPAAANTQIDEVWFSGCHTNIGGGYCDTNLSNIAFIWVLKAAQDAGILIDLRGLPDFDWERSHRGGRRDSYTEFYTELGLVGGIAKLFNIKRAPRVIRQGQRIRQHAGCDCSLAQRFEAKRRGADDLHSVFRLTHSMGSKTCVDAQIGIAWIAGQFAVNSAGD